MTGTLDLRSAFAVRYGDIWARELWQGGARVWSAPYNGPSHVALVGPATVWADTAGTVPLSLGGVCARLDAMLPGMPALLQATEPSRPRFGRHPKSGVRNLFASSEEPNTSWTRTGVTFNAPNLIENTTTGFHRLSQQASVVAGKTYTQSYTVAAGSRSRVVIQFGGTGGYPFSLAGFDLVTKSITGSLGQIEDLGDRVRISHSVVANATASTALNALEILGPGGERQYAGDGVSGIQFYNAQLEVAAAPSAYQAATTQWDVTEAGQADVYYLQGDGADDWMQSAANIDLSAETRGTLIAALEKFSDPAGWIAMDHGNQADGNLRISKFVGASNWQGSTFQGFPTAVAAFTGTQPAPDRAVLSLTVDRAASLTQLRYDGAIAGANSGSLTGNLRSAPLTLFSRATGVGPFPGRYYGHVLRGGAMTSAELATAETYLMRRIGLA